MEKRKLKELLKKIIKYLSVPYIFTFFMLYLGCEGEIEEFIGIYLGLLIFPALLIVIVITIYWVLNLLKGKNDYNGMYYREIENLCPPAMLSFLLDGVVESKEDLLATILNLSIKKFLKIEKRGDELIIGVIAKKQEMRKLYGHEKYVIDHLEANIPLALDEFIKIVISDCEENKLIVKRKKSLRKSITAIVEIIMMILAIIAFAGGKLGMSPKLAVFSMFLIFLLSIILIIVRLGVNDYRKTGKGIDFSAKAKMLKNYINEYTLLEEKDADYLEVVDKYIPYALALGEAEKIENLYIMKDINFIDAMLKM